MPSVAGLGREIDHVGRDIDGEPCAGAVELHDRVAGRAIGGDLSFATWSHGATTREDVWHLAELVDERLGDCENVG